MFRRPRRVSDIFAEDGGLAGGENIFSKAAFFRPRFSIMEASEDG